MGSSGVNHQDLVMYLFIVSVDERSTVAWIILTMGNREKQLKAAVKSLRSQTDASPTTEILVVHNAATGPGDSTATTDSVLFTGENLGVPGGRDAGLQATSTDVVGFLDDDAVASPGATQSVFNAFKSERRLGAVALRLIDEDGRTSRRHIPRLGSKDPEKSGDVPLFLGGACAIRREAYEQVGGYFTDLFYGHEELELSWRLVDAGWTIRYLADVKVFHPRTTIERHADGWELTGRNRVMIARRTLPWPVAMVHLVTWLVIGMWRAPKGESRRKYFAGWRSGWRFPVSRQPISWKGIYRLTRLGRPPII
jgi:GT2 family glycosyltransferase